MRIMPIDINELRDYKGGDPAKWRQYMEQRFKDPGIVDKVLELDTKWRDLRASFDQLNKTRNKLQNDVIAPKKKRQENCNAELAQLQEIKDSIKTTQLEVPALKSQPDSLLNRIGNATRSIPKSPLVKTKMLTISSFHSVHFRPKPSLTIISCRVA